VPAGAAEIRNVFLIAARAIADSDGLEQLAQRKNSGRQSRILERCKPGQQLQCVAEQATTSWLALKLLARQRC
jgi:hypothetical protein